MQIPKVIWNSRGKSINIFGKGYKCSITGDLYPDLCFVTPLYWNETGDERWLTRGQLNAYNTLFSDGPGVNALVSHEACSQEPWNMICLSSEVRPLWYQCRFGLKYLGSTDQGIDKEVKVQFVWMPLMPGSDTWEMTNVCEEVASGEHDRTIDKLKRVHNISEAQVQDRDGRNMISGRIFSIRVREEDFKLFVAMLKLQGNLVRLAAMSGVAQAVLDECPRSQSPADIWTPGTSEDGHCLSVC